MVSAQEIDWHALRAAFQQLRITVELAIMFVYRLVSTVLLASVACSGLSLPKSMHLHDLIKPRQSKPLQDIVTWDEYSIRVHGERIMLYNAEFHPFRLPVPDLWLDVFQKLRSAGFSAVSFYTHWAQLEGKPGDFSAEDIFALEPFFEAAKQAGIYLIARPGPYINAEATGGGFPGWLQRAPAIGRTREFLPYTENYVRHITPILAKAQITNGGPIILFQPENEYTLHTANVSAPDKTYFTAVEQMFRDQGIVVPLVSNDQYPAGLFAPGTGQGAVDIYGYDSYPLGFDCSDPRAWPNGALPTDFLDLHVAQSPSTPHTISEFQGGAFDPWGGVGFEKCATLLDEHFERVFFKSLYGAHVTIFNVYMGFGGTNWGNLGHPGGYTSYDYGAAIAEDRNVSRSKYSEIKLQANFLKASPEYLVAKAQASTNGSYVSSPDLATSKLSSGQTDFYVVRHSMYNSNSSTSYKLNVPSSAGNLSIPARGSLTLNGRDSKIHVVDYQVGGSKLLYSTAEIFTWQKDGDQTLLILYGGLGETHEARSALSGSVSLLEGSDVAVDTLEDSVILNWAVSTQRRIAQLPKGLRVLLLSQEDAFNYWVLDLPAAAPYYNYTTAKPSSIVVKGGYFLRTASMNGNALSLVGDINSTTTFEVVSGASCHTPLSFNGHLLSTSCNANGLVEATVKYVPPTLSLPNIRDLPWKHIDSLPEIRSTYDDAAWTHADHPTSNNTQRGLTTPTSLYASDYGFHAGTLLTRGHFTAAGNETYFFAETWGGFGYASAIFLNDALLTGFAGRGANSTGLQNATLPALRAGERYVLTVVTDNMGLEEDFVVGGDQYKNPRGIVNYALGGRDASAITWSITGNLGGEDYQDRTRGPLNEGGLWVERQGYHLPGAPIDDWTARSPFAGTQEPGVAFYAANFALDMPEGYDIPLSFVFTNTTGASYRCQLYVNGYQFGKYVNNVGPQTSFPVPEGILNYHGNNYVALSLWSFDQGGNGLSGLDLVSTARIMTGYTRPRNAPMTGWKRRAGAY